MNVIGAILLAAVAVVVLGALSAWPVMLLWGAIAGTYGFPTMGFGTALQVTLLSSLLFKSASS